MQNPFENTNINPDSFDFEAYLASFSAQFAEDLPINAQDPRYTRTAPPEQGQTVSAFTEGQSSMTSMAGFETQASNPSTSSLASATPQISSELSFYHALAQGESVFSPHFDQLQRLAQSNLQPSPISPSGPSTPAPALSRSSSGRRQATPSISDEERDVLPLPNLPSNATKKERAEHKREQNRRAATRARRRREAQMSRMEHDVVRLQREADIWRERARMMEGLLAKAGVTIPAFPDVI